jgi:hypothetical protein
MRVAEPNKECDDLVFGGGKAERQPRSEVLAQGKCRWDQRVTSRKVDGAAGLEALYRIT